MASRLLLSTRHTRKITFIYSSPSVQLSKPVSTTVNNKTIVTENTQGNKTFREKARDTWNGPNFKYWFIGGTGFLSWLAYYSLKAYKKKCIQVEVLPPLPNHSTVERMEEIEDLWKIYNAQSSILSYHNVKKLMILGLSSSGKTVLVNDFVKKVQKYEMSKYTLPKSSVTVFLQADNELSFLTSLKAFAAKLEIKMSNIDEILEGSEQKFHTASFEEKCRVLVQCIQDTLKKHPGWTIVFDQVQSTTSDSVLKLINEFFLENTSEWSSGTVIIVADGVKDKKVSVDKTQKYAMKTGMNVKDSCQLLRQIVNIDNKYVTEETLQMLSNKVFSNPLGILCAGVLLREKLTEKEINSIESVVKDLCLEIEQNVKQVLQKNHHMSAFTSTLSGLKLVTIETVVAMIMKDVVKNDIYLKHGFDLMAALAPGVAVPHSVVSRHLIDPYFKLPALAKRTGILDFMNKQKRDADDVQKNADEFDPKGKAWSNKNLAHYMRKVEDFFESSYKTLKDIYNVFYSELPPLPEKEDGLTMFRSCELLQMCTLEPGGVKAMCMHPMVYNVARQHFLTTTTEMEAKHLQDSQTLYNNLSWYRRMSSFSEQACLQQFRNNAGYPSITKNLNEQSAENVLFRFNLGVDVSHLFDKGYFKDKSEIFWFPTAIERLRYLQDHVSRVVTSLCEQIHVSKDDLAGHSTKKNLMAHLEYILQNQPLEILGSEKQIEGLMKMANGYTNVYKDPNTSKQLLDQVLELQKSSDTTNPLDIGKTLTEKAQYHSNRAEYEEARLLLEQACEIYESNRKKLGEYKRPIEFGKLLGTLGTVYGSLNMKVDSKETIERALMLQQSVPPDTSDEEKSKKFGSEFASMLIDLGHAYTSLGLPLYGKKILDLALAAQKNLNGENHPEVVRALTILAIAHLLQGHNDESKKLRREAGKIQAGINKMPLY